MPTFLVRFPTPVVYLPMSPAFRRVLTELAVNAPDAEAATIHAIRVVEGDVTGLTAEEVDKISLRPPPVTDTAPDPPPILATTIGDSRLPEGWSMPRHDPA